MSQRVRDGGRNADAVAIAALGRLAADEDRLGLFMSLSGVGPGEIRDAARDPGFLAAVLDHVASDDGLLVAVANELGLRPGDVMAARQALSPEMPRDP